MPQLRLAGRRWRIATDTVPLLALFLALVHVALLIPLAIFKSIMSSSNYECNKKMWVEAADVGILVCYFVLAANEVALLVMGMRGGPLEERKRRVMRPFLYLEVAMWVVALGFTIFATVVVASPGVADTCFATNPCAAVETGFIPAVCTPAGNGTYELSAPCAAIAASGDEFQACWGQWLDLSAGYMVRSYNATLRPVPFLPPALAAPPPELCSLSVSAQGAFFADWIAARNATLGLPDLSAGVVAATHNASAFVEDAILELVGAAPGPTLGTAAAAPWWSCLEPPCQALLAAGDACSEWDLLFGVPDAAADRKAAFQGAVYASWAVLGVTGLLVWAVLNGSPDYGTVDSWEGTVKTLSRLFCCAGALAAAETEGGQPVSREIGALLHLLFGAVDLDVSDQILGIGLVAERQQLRREAHVLRVLAAAGVRPARRPARGRLGAAWARVRAALLRAGDAAILTGADEGVALTNTLDEVADLETEPETEPGGGEAAPAAPAAPAAVRPAWVRDESGESRTSVAFGSGDDLPASPFSDGGSSAGGSFPATPNTSLPTPPPPAGLASRAHSARGLSSGALPPSPFTAADGPAAPPRSLASAMASSLPPSPFSSGPGHSGSSVPPPPPPRSAHNGGSGAAAGGGGAIDGPPAATPLTPLPMPMLVSALSRQFGERDEVRPTMGFAQSFVRLVSMRPGVHASSAARRAAAAAAASDTPRTRASKALALSQPAHLPGQQLEAADRRQPLLTPLRVRHLRLPLSGYEAAALYVGGVARRRVAVEEMRDAQDVSRFALAAYGLQGVRWKGGAEAAQRQDACGARLDAALQLCGACVPGRLDSRFRKRNLDALLHITGCAASDLLYVNYVNAPSGILPYMLLLDRPAKRVVLAVRGTVSMADLITDLLSSPVDATDALPEWVRQAAAPGDELFAHSGILSSTNAVLRDLRERGLLAAVAGAGGGPAGAGAAADAAAPAPQPGMRRAGDASLPAVPEGDDESAPPPAAPEVDAASERRRLARLRTLAAGDEVELPLGRALSLLRRRVRTQGWGLVVTGHSLGAAVASVLSFHLRAHFPALRCFAFSPPGGLLSAPLAAAARPFCTSVVVGRDAISRLGLAGVQRVVDDMVLALARCRRAKLRVAADAVAGRRADPATAPPTFCALEDLGDEALAVLEKYCATSKLHAASTDARDLFPPGRIMHLRPYEAALPPGMDPAGRAADALPEVWDAAWVSPQAVMGEGILLSRSMMEHHRMATLEVALRSAIAGEAAAGAAGGDEGKPTGDEAV